MTTAEQPEMGDPGEALEIIQPMRPGNRVRIRLEPPGKMMSLPRPKTVRQLLEALNLEEEEALVARDGRLLTPDRRVWPDDVLLVRMTASRG